MILDNGIGIFLFGSQTYPLTPPFGNFYRERLIRDYFALLEKKYWNKGINLVAGIDEAGRGPLAGPVVAACVIFDVKLKIDDIKDSKKLTAKKRDLLFHRTIY